MRITHPHPVQGRQKFVGIEFRDGFAQVDTLDPIIEQTLLQHRFTIEHDAITDLESLTVRELRGLAEIEGIELPAKASKAELVDLISRVPAVEQTADKSEEEFAILELADGTVVGDGTTMVTLHPDGTAEV